VLDQDRSLALAVNRGYNVRRMSATQITWRDVLEMPEDGKRYEAIGGELYVTPPPRTLHQRVSYLLGVELYRLLEEPGHRRVYAAPIGVEHPVTGEGVQPDLLFVSGERLHIVHEDWIRGAPDLVIEIASPSTARRDRTVKLDFYRRLGVPVYWVVAAEAKQVLAWPLAAGATEPERYTDRVPVRLGARVVGELELAQIFERR
jgi:Uma2 family endonuclease